MSLAKFDLTIALTGFYNASSKVEPISDHITLVFYGRIDGRLLYDAMIKPQGVNVSHMIMKVNMYSKPC